MRNTLRILAERFLLYRKVISCRVKKLPGKIPGSFLNLYFLFYFFRLHAQHVLFTFFSDIIFLFVLAEVCVIFETVRRIDLTVADMHIRVLFATLHQGYHGTCTMGCNSSEAIQDIVKYSSLFQPAIAIAQSFHMVHLQLVTQMCDDHTERSHPLCCLFIIIQKSVAGNVDSSRTASITIFSSFHAAGEKSV